MSGAADSALLAGRTALVTGGGRGLGAALCEVLASAGARVVIADRRGELAVAEAARLVERGLAARATVIDVGDAEEAAGAIEEVIEVEGGLDILINNAGVDVTKPVTDMAIGEWDLILATNLRGPFLLCQRAIEPMARRGGGHIINICSTAAKRNWPNAAAYHASKWGLLGFSHALHAELRPRGIKVTAAIVGGMRTPFLFERFPDIDPATLQAPANVAATLLGVLTLPGDSVVPEITILPMGETSWP